MDEFESLPHNPFGYREGWTQILRIDTWMRELKRMIPDVYERETWIKANCSRMRLEFTDRGPDTLTFYMRRDAFRQLMDFRGSRPSLRYGGYNRAPVIIPEYMWPLAVLRQHSEASVIVSFPENT